MPRNMKNDWWFKFEYSKWDDPSLQLCRMETQGFWLRIYLALRKSVRSDISATVEKLSSLAGCTVAEAVRSITELRQFDVADVTLCNAQNVTRNSLVTLASRSLKRELSSKEKTKLRVQKHRGNADVTHDVTLQSKSKKKEVDKEEDKNGAKPPVETDPIERRIWKEGVELLTRNGMNGPNARTYLGKLVRDYTKPLVAESIAVTQAENAADPKSFLMKVLQARSKPNPIALVGKSDSGPECAECQSVRFIDEGGKTIPCPSCRTDDYNFVKSKQAA